MQSLPLSYALNKVNVNKFIAASDESVRHTVKKIFEVTKHVSYEEYITILNKNIRQILIEKDKYLKGNTMKVYIPDNIDFQKTAKKSNIWIMQYVINFIQKQDPSINIEILNKDVIYLQENDTIFIIDDCIYSGYQLSGIIKQIRNANNVKVNVYLLVSFSSSKGIRNIRDSLLSNRTMKATSRIITPRYMKTIQPIIEYITSPDLEELFDFYNIELTDTYLYPIYFDHKLADNVSTLTEIYSGLVPNKYNKAIIDLYKRLGEKQSVLKSLQIIPVIKNCEKITLKDLDFHNPQCPSPPYKASHIQFLRSSIDRQSIFHRSVSPKNSASLSPLKLHSRANSMPIISRSPSSPSRSSSRRSATNRKRALSSPQSHSLTNRSKKQHTRLV